LESVNTFLRNREIYFVLVESERVSLIIETTSIEEGGGNEELPDILRLRSDGRAARSARSVARSTAGHTG
jgi:hypothetical protein